MMKQPEALRLADALEQKEYPPRVSAARELRRLYAANIDCMNHFNALMEERNELLKALKLHIDMDVAYRRGPKVEDAVEIARAAIAKATEQTPSQDQ